MVVFQKKRIESQRIGRKGRVAVVNRKSKVMERTPVSRDGLVKEGILDSE